MRERGFTLLELVIVFSIISVLSIIGIAAFVNYGRIQALQAAATQLSSTLSLAKSRAISQTKPTQCSNQILNGYKVVISTTNNSYELDVVCSNFTYAIQSFNLPKNITFDAEKTTSTSFFFPVIVDGVKGGIIYLNGYGNTKDITVQ